MYFKFSQFLNIAQPLIERGDFVELMDHILRLPAVQALEAIAHFMTQLDAGDREKLMAVLQAMVGSPKFQKRHSGLPGHFRLMLRFLQADKHAVDRYLSSDSRAWRKIREHIVKAKECLLIARQPYAIVCHRGSGHAISVQHVHGYCDTYDQTKDYRTIRIPPLVYFLAFTVTYERDFEETFSKKYELQVPLALEDDCSESEFESRFNKWAMEVAVKRAEEATKEELPELERLLARYPKEARKFLREKGKKATKQTNTG